MPRKRKGVALNTCGPGPTSYAGAEAIDLFKFLGTAFAIESGRSCDVFIL